MAHKDQKPVMVDPETHGQLIKLSELFDLPMGRCIKYLVSSHADKKDQSMVKFCPIHPYRMPCDCNCALWAMTSEAHIKEGAALYIESDDPAFEKRPYCMTMKSFLDYK